MKYAIIVETKDGKYYEEEFDDTAKSAYGVEERIADIKKNGFVVETPKGKQEFKATDVANVTSEKYE